MTDAYGLLLLLVLTLIVVGTVLEVRDALMRRREGHRD